MTLNEPQRTLMDGEGFSPYSIGNSTLWGIPEIAAFLKKGHSTARKYAADQCFPAPIMGAQRDRRWFPDEVIAYFRTSRQPTPGPQLQIPTQLVPHRITTKSKKVRAA